MKRARAGVSVCEERGLLVRLISAQVRKKNQVCTRFYWQHPFAIEKHARFTREKVASSYIYVYGWWVDG